MRKNIFNIFIFILLSALFSDCNHSSPQSVKYFSVNHSDEMKMLQDFYSAWITEGSMIDKSVERRIDSVRTLFCSVRLRKYLDSLTFDDLDYDPFLDSQMVDTLMLKNLSIEADSTHHGNFTARYDYGQYKSIIRLGLKKVKNRYLIDRLPDLEERLIQQKSQNIDSITN